MSVKYSKTHEWANIEGNKAKVGISDYAQKELGDLVFINLPNVGDTVVAGEYLCDVESVKAVSDVNSPVSGKVIAVNTDLEDAPELINENALEAWICEIEVSDEGSLMTEDEYKEFTK